MVFLDIGSSRLDRGSLLMNWSVFSMTGSRNINVKLRDRKWQVHQGVIYGGVQPMHAKEAWTS
jgi:hypothetical protein